MQPAVTVEPRNLDNLRFRRQFILGPVRTECPPSWRCVSIPGNLWLSVHPDLELTEVAKQHKTLILLGYALDLNAPEADNLEILDALIKKFNQCDEIFEHVNDLGGRWVLLVNDGHETILLHDAAGLRQVYYAAGDSVWCASETGLLASNLKLQVDDEALALTRFKDLRVRGVYWWPGDTSMYREVKALLPNHFLNIGTGRPRRYWPNRAIGTLSIQEAVAKCSRMLRAQIRSAHARFDLALSCTAGWDSRLMMAACKEVMEQLYFFTLTYQDDTRDSPDLAVPISLSRKLGFELDVIKYAEEESPEFANVLGEAIPSIDPEGFADIQSMYGRYPQGRVCVSGHVAEVTKCFYSTEGRSGRGIDAEVLAEITRMGMHPFALDAYRKWLETADTRHLKLLDLFCWEQMAGRWQARIGGTYDLVHESFNPYNCRTLLETMLAVDEKFRKPPHFEFHRALIRSLWSEVLSEPINPPVKKRLRQKLKQVFVRTGVYHLIPRRWVEFARKVLR